MTFSQHNSYVTFPFLIFKKVTWITIQNGKTQENGELSYSKEKKCSLIEREKKTGYDSG